MSRRGQLDNFVFKPVVDQIVYKDMGNANYSGKVIRILPDKPGSFLGHHYTEYQAEVKWPNGTTTIESYLRDSEIDLNDRKRFVAAAMKGIRKAKAL